MQVKMYVRAVTVEANQQGKVEIERVSMNTVNPDTFVPGQDQVHGNIEIVRTNLEAFGAFKVGQPVAFDL